MLDSVQGIIMVLDSVYPSLGGGGAEAQVATLGRWLTQGGITTTIVVPMVAIGPQQRRERIDGVPVVRIGYPKLRLLGSLVLLFKLFWLLVANRRRIVAIHAHIGGNMAVVATLAGRLLGKPVIVKMTGMTEMRHGVLDPQAGASARLKRRILQKATAIQATSREIVDRLAACGFDPRRVHRIPNAVDTVRFDPARRQPGRESAALTGIYVGRLEPEKGVDLLVEAWRQAYGAAPDIRLVIVGSGALAGPLKTRVDALGLTGAVEFVGQSPQVEHFLARADFGILASHAEGLSNTMLETLAAGLPMVVSQVSGAEDFIEPGRNGWLFPPGDRDALADRLRDVRAAGRARLRAMGEAAREQVLAQASIGMIGQRLVGLYGLVRPPPPAAAAAAAGADPRIQP